MSEEKLQAKLRKLQALAERGVGGEKETAQRMLKAMLKRHGLSLDDLNDDKREVRWFKYNGKFELALAYQVLGKVTDCCKPGAFKSKARRSRVGIEVTPAEAVEFELHFVVLARALGECLDDAYRAFVQANGIFPPTSRSEDAGELSDRDLRIMQMACAIERTQIRRRLESGGSDV